MWKKLLMAAVVLATGFVMLQPDGPEMLRDETLKGAVGACCYWAAALGQWRTWCVRRAILLRLCKEGLVGAFCVGLVLALVRIAA